MASVEVELEGSHHGIDEDKALMSMIVDDR